MRPGVMVGSSVWVVSGGGRGWWCGARCVWPVPGILGVPVGAGLLIVVVCPPVCPWSWCRRLAAACVRGWVPLCVAVVVGCNRCIVADISCNCEACSFDAPGVVTPDTAPDISEPN